MSDYALTHPVHHEAAATSADLTALEIVTYVVSALIGTVIVALIVVMMLP